jgi:hypothetical protein
VGASLEWLARAVQHHSLGVQWLKVEPLWDPVRSNPRFARMLDSMGLGFAAEGPAEVKRA